jgi:hypothetical protein
MTDSALEAYWAGMIAQERQRREAAEASAEALAEALEQITWADHGSAALARDALARYRGEERDVSEWDFTRGRWKS